MGREEDDDNVVYGSRLVQEDELVRREGKSAILKGQARRVAPWQQEVTDAEGRRRFHGALTGGFSAGYYNTVASKEGWTPSSFISSRNQRAGKKEQTVYDFLDEDEKAELKLKELLPRAECDAVGSTAAEVARRIASNETKLWSSVVPGLVHEEIVSESQSRVVNNRRGLGVVALKPDHGNQVESNRGLQGPPERLLLASTLVGTFVIDDIAVQKDAESGRGMFSKRSNSEAFSKKDNCLPSFTAATSPSLPNQPLRLPSLVIPVDFTSAHALPAPLDAEQYLSRQEPREVPPPDHKTTKAVNGVAAFVARSGPKFEDILKQKHVKNPQFPFLFEGCAGHEFYARKLWEEQRNLSMQGKKQILSRSDNNRADLVGANRGRILGEKPLPRTEISVASLTNSKEESSSLDPSEVLSELTAQMNTRFTTGASDTQLNRVEGNNHPSDPKHSSDTNDLPQNARRVETLWRPTVLLCKRLNLLDPFNGEVEIVRQHHYGMVLKASSFPHVLETLLPKPRIKPEPLTNFTKLLGTGEEPSLNVSKPQPSASATNAWTNEDTRDTIISENSTDLYKAIFSEDEDEDQRGSLSSSREPALDPKDAAGEFLVSLGKELGLRV